MLDTNIFHALGLHMHQPPGNLALLIEANPWEAEQIIRCYERPTRYARQYADVGHLHIGFSGILLEQFLDPDIVDRYRHIIDIPAMLDAYRDTPNIELIGMGYFHPIFPLIPEADWDEQLQRGRELMKEVFGRAPRGFWPPEMAFSMEMIPALVRAGYEYVVVDGVHVHPEDGVSDVFRPYLACHDDVCITVVPRDRDVSNAQESGLDASWFAHEVTHRCRFSPRPDEPRLCTTWSDGENGGWFRQTHEGSGFFGHYFSPYMEHVRGGEYPIRPVGLSEYLAAHPASTHAHVQTGAWNVGSTSGFDLSQWAGSPGQRRGVETVSELSRRWWALHDARKAPPERLERARRLVLEAETSCYLFWGDDWLPKLAVLTDAAAALMAPMEEGASAKPAAGGHAVAEGGEAPAAEPEAPAKPAGVEPVGVAPAAVVPAKVETAPPIAPPQATSKATAPIASPSDSESRSTSAEPLETKPALPRTRGVEPVEPESEQSDRAHAQPSLDGAGQSAAAAPDLAGGAEGTAGPATPKVPATGQAQGTSAQAKSAASGNQAGDANQKPGRKGASRKKRPGKRS
jgi:hypothetical protein